ncbi:hypothetical protein CRG98_044584 [Punica granatum]|uniref:Uncharacterized protein n=1 Tax=Punica granatum TaxID=22663 RepID=A0A2I0HTI5_PUNGR|nr:hypothetical protein CRG98_044584 [Punica granatum]
MGLEDFLIPERKGKQAMSVDQWNATEGMMKSGSESSRASETGMTYKQKSKSEKKAAEGTPVGAQSPKLTRTQRRKMLRKRASAKKKLQAEAERKANVGLAVKYTAENKAGKGDHKRLEKEETSSAELIQYQLTASSYFTLSRLVYSSNPSPKAFLCEEGTTVTGCFLTADSIPANLLSALTVTADSYFFEPTTFPEAFLVKA